jgi:hypothetical protein
MATRQTGIPRITTLLLEELKTFMASASMPDLDALRRAQ